MKKLILLCCAAILAMTLFSCSKEVEIVVKNKIDQPYGGALVCIFPEHLPEVEKLVVMTNQREAQNKFIERLVLAGASIEEAKKIAKEEYDKNHNERPDMNPYGFVTHEMAMECIGPYVDKKNDPKILEKTVSGKTNAMGTLTVKLKEGEYYILIEDNNHYYYGPLNVYENGTNVFTLK